MRNNAATSIGQLAWQKFKKNSLGVVAATFIIFVTLLAIFAYVLAPDNVANANQMHLAIHTKPPGFEVQMLRIPIQNVAKKNSFKKFLFGDAVRFEELPILSYETQGNSITVIPYQGTKNALVKSYSLSLWQDNKPIIKARKFYLGTDKYGRDLLSRLLIGTRISLSIGFVAVFISLLIGLILGAVAGYYGGKIDALIMWFINISWSIPTLLLVIAITLALGKGFWQVFIAVGLTMWVDIARMVRGQVMSVKKQQYVAAGEALGFADFRIISKHILPNIMAPVIVMAAANFAAAILIESGLSFLGVGAQAPMPSWGGIIKDHYQYIILGKPYLAIIPGLAIMSLVMAFMLIGNALRDALDVKN